MPTADILTAPATQCPVDVTAAFEIIELHRAAVRAGERPRGDCPKCEGAGGHQVPVYEDLGDGCRNQVDARDVRCAPCLGTGWRRR